MERIRYHTLGKKSAMKHDFYFHIIKNMHRCIGTHFAKILLLKLLQKRVHQALQNEYMLTIDILLDKKIIRDEAESNQKGASKARKEERRKNKNKKRKESKGNLEDKLGPLEELIKYLIQKNHGSRE